MRCGACSPRRRRVADRPTANLAAAAALVDELWRAGVRHACLAPGARSGPLAVATAAHAGVRDWIVTDERSAGFFALGLARARGEAVALVCTSGTAAANLLPAVVEASLSEIPLIVLTADRPPELRGWAAAQTIDQVGLYGTHARWSVDAPVPDPGVDLDAFFRALAGRAVAVATADPRGPVHLNVPLREPLLPAGGMPPIPGRPPGESPRVRLARVTQVLDGEEADRLASALAAEERGLVVCGPRANASGAEAAVAELATRLGWPVLADPLSGLRFMPDVHGVQADAYDLMLRDPAFVAAHRPRAVLRLGAMPVSKALATALTAAHPPLDVVVATPGTWPDPDHAASCLVPARPAAVLDALLARLPHRGETAWARSWSRASRAVRTAVDGRLAAEDRLFEGKVASELVRLLPAGATLHVGNSMPVRDLDTFGGGNAHRIRVEGNRGASGIDGVLSAALGAAAGRAEPVALLVGDLSFLHDVGALQIAARHRLDALVVVVNNDGGGIFSFLPAAGYGATFERCFATPHGLELAAVSGIGGARHVRIETWEAFRRAVRDGFARPGLDVVEVPTRRDLNVALHAEYVDLARQALAGARGRSAAA